MSIGKIIPGLAAAVLIAALAYLIGSYIPNLSATLLSLLFGILAGNLVLGKPGYEAGIRFTEKYILESAIVLIGFGFKLQLLQQLGLPIFGWLVFSVVAVVSFALLVGKLFGTSTNFNYLLGAGSAICGSAAIAATAPLIKAKEEETGLALTVINLLGLVGIGLLPLLTFALGHTEIEAGLLTGGSLQSMGHVVAAAFSLNATTGEVATVVKMARISLLVPFLLFIFFSQRKKNKGSSAKLKFPAFIGLFILAVAISQLAFFPSQWSALLATAGDLLLIIAMAGIGLRIKIRPLLKISARGSLIGLIVFLFQILFFLVLIGFHLF